MRRFGVLGAVNLGRRIRSRIGRDRLEGRGEDPTRVAPGLVLVRANVCDATARRTVEVDLRHVLRYAGSEQRAAGLRKDVYRWLAAEACGDEVCCDTVPVCESVASAG